MKSGNFFIRRSPPASKSSFFRGPAITALLYIWNLVC